jgi:hydrogenase large subunit
MAFVNQVYIPDLLAVAGFYKDWGAIGGGLENYMAYGDLPENGYGDPSHFKFPRGVILNRNLAEVLPVDGKSADQVQEFISSSWYEYAGGDGAGLHPWAGETNLKYSGPKPPYEFLDVTKKYSWLKTPRWKGHAMEVGPLARLLVAYASGREEVKEAVNGALKALDVPVAALFSTLGRTAARGIETQLIAGWSKEFYAQLLTNIKNGDTRTFNNARWDPETWPEEAKGVGMSEAPRGALAHWIVIKEKKIDNYQLVVPSTWNASPRDAKGERSAYEASLIGTPVNDPEKPLEVLRTIHSFDPCLACAVHLYDERGTYVHQIDTF